MLEAMVEVGLADTAIVLELTPNSVELLLGVISEVARAREIEVPEELTN